MMAALKWDDAKLLAAPKIASYPLQLRDAEVLLLRDKLLQPPPGAAPSAAPADASRAGRGRGRCRFGGVSVGGSVAPARERGVQITTIFDAPPAGRGADTAGEGRE